MKIDEIQEFRGVSGLVAAEVLVDDGDNYTCDTPFAVAGVAEVSKTTEATNDSHYYDNVPAIVIVSNGPDTIAINTSAIPLEIQAKLSGNNYDSATGAMIEGTPKPKYFALGYQFQTTSREQKYVWRYKGMFSAATDSTHTTKDAGTDANGQSLTYTGINTTHEFTKTGESAKGMVVDVDKDLADVSAFFDAVTTPDTLTAKTSYTLTITQASNTTVTVKRNGQTVASGATIYAGDHLEVSVTGGTLTLNSAAWSSGDIHIVSGNVAIVSTASA